MVSRHRRNWLPWGWPIWCDKGGKPCPSNSRTNSAPVVICVNWSARPTTLASSLPTGRASGSTTTRWRVRARSWPASPVPMPPALPPAPRTPSRVSDRASRCPLTRPSVTAAMATQPVCQPVLTTPCILTRPLCMPWPVTCAVATPNASSFATREQSV